MTIRDLKGAVEDRIPVNTVLISVFDKTGLEQLVPELKEINPEVLFLSTSGTYLKIQNILGSDYKKNLGEIAEYTDFPEMEGGLVKTLHPKLHAGILGERNNPKHQIYLKETLKDAKYIDMVIFNLYPFEQIIQGIAEGKIDKSTGNPFNFETARGYIDIGGPSGIRGAAKNFPGCASICDPKDYDAVLRNIKENNGSTTFDQRFELALKVFETTYKYDKAIHDYLAKEKATKGIQEIRKIYTFS